MRRATTLALCLVQAAQALKCCRTARPPLAAARHARPVVATAEDYAAVYRDDACVGAGIDERLFKLNEGLIDVVKGFIDAAYEGRDYARFYVLETLARVPYFAYVSVLHLRETFGARDADHVARIRVHFAEADNELHHLLIVEALGGNSSAVDRTVAQALAFGYFWYVCAVYAANPRAAYHLSELVEDHAFRTYSSFLETRGDALRREPAPAVAVDYYGAPPFGRPASEPAPPPPATLYDVFSRIRDDERGHWENLAGLVQFDDPEPGLAAAPTRPCAPDDEACLVVPDDCAVPVYSR